MMKGNQTLSCVCDPQGVGTGLTTYPRVFGAAPLDLWLGNGHPQGVPAPTNPARQVPDPAFIALSQRMTGPAYIALSQRMTGPAYIALYRRGEDPTFIALYQRMMDSAYIALYRRGEDPAFVATYHRPEDPAFIALYRRGEDPAWDPRFIATGRAATAAMTCGQIIVRTSTPCGSH